jgi:hypothetical protein
MASAPSAIVSVGGAISRAVGVGGLTPRQIWRIGGFSVFCSLLLPLLVRQRAPRFQQLRLKPRPAVGISQGRVSPCRTLLRALIVAGGVEADAPILMRGCWVRPAGATEGGGPAASAIDPK